jgi:hypothetical protein
MDCVVAPAAVTAACWSPDGACIAYAQQGATLCIVEPGHESASPLLESWPIPADLPDFEGAEPRVDSLAWLPDAPPASSGPASQLLRGTLLACTALPGDDGDDSDVTPLLAMRWHASGDATPVVFASSQAILGVCRNACDASSGPHLRVACLPAWRLAVMSHRKAGTEHIRLLGIPPAADDVAAPTEMEVVEDREKPSVKCTSSGEDNFVCGLALCAARVGGGAAQRAQCPNLREPDRDGGLLRQGPLLCVATTDGRLWVYASGTYDPATYSQDVLITPAELPAAPPAAQPAVCPPPEVPPPEKETPAPPPPPPPTLPTHTPLPSPPPPTLEMQEQGPVNHALSAAPMLFPPVTLKPPVFPPAPPALPQPEAMMPAVLPAAASTAPVFSSPFTLGAALSLDTWATKTTLPPPAPVSDAPTAAAVAVPTPAPVQLPKAPEPVPVPATPPPAPKSPDPLKFKADMPSPSPPAPPAHVKQAPGPVTHEGGLFSVSADMKDTIAEVGALASDIEALITKCRLGHDSAPFASASVDGLVAQTDGLKDSVASLGTGLAACRTAFAALRSAHHDDERLCAELQDVWALREDGAEGSGGGDTSDDGDWHSDAPPPRRRGASRHAARLEPSLEALRSTLWRQMMGVTSRLNDLETGLDALQSAHRAASNPGGAAALLCAYVRSAEDIMERADAAAAELDGLLERTGQMEGHALSSPMAASEGEDVGEDVGGTPGGRGVLNGTASFAQLSLSLANTPLSGQAYGSASRGATGEQVRRALLRSVGTTPRRVAVTPTGAAAEERPSTPSGAPLPPQPPRMAPLSPTLVAPPPPPSAPSPPPPAPAPKLAETPAVAPPPPVAEKQSLSPSLPSLGALCGLNLLAQPAATPLFPAAAPTPVAAAAAAPVAPAPPAPAVPPLATSPPSIGSPKRRVHSTSHMEQEEPRAHKGFGQTPFTSPQPAPPPAAPPSPAVPASVGLQWGAASQPGAATAALAQLGAVPKAIVADQPKTAPGAATPPAAPAWSFPLVVEPPKAAASSEGAKPAAPSAAPASTGFAWPSAPVAGPKSPFAAAAPETKSPALGEVAQQAPPQAAPAPTASESAPPASPGAEAKASPPMPSSPVSGAAAPALDFGKGFSSLGFGTAPASSAPATPAESPFAKGLNLGPLPPTASAPAAPSFGTTTGLGGGGMFGQPQAAAPLFPALSAPSAIGLGSTQASAASAGQPVASSFGTPSSPGMFGVGAAAAAAPALPMSRPMGMSAGFGQAATPGFGQPSVMTAALPAFGQASSLSGVASPGAASGGAASTGNAFSNYARSPASPFAQVAGQGAGFGGGGASPFAALAQQQQQQQQQGGAFGGFSQQQAPPQGGGFGFAQNAAPGQGAFGMPAAQGFGAQPGFGAAAQPMPQRPAAPPGGDFSQMRR